MKLMSYSPSALKPKYKPTLTMAEITNTIKRVFGENEAKKLSSVLGCTSYSLISRVSGANLNNGNEFLCFHLNGVDFSFQRNPFRLQTALVPQSLQKGSSHSCNYFSVHFSQLGSRRSDNFWSGFLRNSRQTYRLLAML